MVAVVYKSWHVAQNDDRDAESQPLVLVLYLPVAEARGACKATDRKDCGLLHLPLNLLELYLVLKLEKLRSQRHEHEEVTLTFLVRLLIVAAIRFKSGVFLFVDEFHTDSELLFWGLARVRRRVALDTAHL